VDSTPQWLTQYGLVVLMLGSVSGLSTGEHYATLKQTGPEKQKNPFYRRQQ